MTCPLCQSKRIKVFYTDPLQYECGDCRGKLHNANRNIPGSETKLVPIIDN